MQKIHPIGFSRRFDTSTAPVTGTNRFDRVSTISDDVELEPGGCRADRSITTKTSAATNADVDSRPDDHASREAVRALTVNPPGATTTPWSPTTWTTPGAKPSASSSPTLPQPQGQRG